MNLLEEFRSELSAEPALSVDGAVSLLRRLLEKHGIPVESRPGATESPETETLPQNLRSPVVDYYSGLCLCRACRKREHERKERSR